MSSPYTVDEAVVLRKATILKANIQGLFHLLSRLNISGTISRPGLDCPPAIPQYSAEDEPSSTGNSF
jgi:hypothetical protein